MVSTNQSREADNRRRDIGSGEYWELLNTDFLNVFFGNNAIKSAVLASFATSGLIHWEDKLGIATMDSSEKFSVLVATPSSCKSMAQFFKNHGGMTGINNKLVPYNGREEMVAMIVDIFSTHVKLGRVQDYNISGTNSLGKFKEDHYTQPGETYPRFRLVTDHTVDTGRSVGFALRSSAQPVQKEVIVPSNPAYAKRSQVKHKAERQNTRFNKIKIALASFNEEKVASDPYIADTFVEPSDANRQEQFIYVSKEGRMDLFNASEQATTPAMSVGGPQSNLRTPTINQHQWGSRKHSYMDEGTQDNPLGQQAPSYFSPTPSVVSSLFSPLGSLVDNPGLIVGLMALVALQNSNGKDTYTVIQKTLPTNIIDNAEVEKELFGE